MNSVKDGPDLRYSTLKDSFHDLVLYPTIGMSILLLLLESIGVTTSRPLSLCENLKITKMLIIFYKKSLIQIILKL
jgi:uncharacterized membrane protein YwaF